MHITDSHLQKFMDLYELRFGESITKEEALRKGLKILRLIKTLYEPMTQEEFERLKSKKAEGRLEKTKLPEASIGKHYQSFTDSLGGPI